MQYFLGADTGATKTSIVILDKKGKILSSTKGGPANLNVTPPKIFKQNIKDAAQEAVQKVGIRLEDIEAACLGIAGLDTDSSIPKAQKLVSEVLPIKKDKLLLVNDVKIIRPACSDKKFGITIIVGTGSNFYGINKNKKEAYVDGLDWLLGDEASAYWIGKRALNAAIRSADFRGPKSLLEDLVLDYFSINNIRDLVNIVYKPTFAKKDVAMLSQLVDSAYVKKDEVAKRIFEEAADEIALSINILVKVLNLKDEDFDIVATGGVFKSKYPLKDNVIARLNKKDVPFIICDSSSAVGAAKLALEL